MEFLFLMFYACLRLRFLETETNPGLLRPVPVVCRIFCSNVRVQAGNLSDLTVASSQYNLLLCSETLVSDMRHWTCQSCWFPDSVARLAVPGQDASGPGIAAYVRDGCTVFRQPKFECDQPESGVYNLTNLCIFCVWSAGVSRSSVCGQVRHHECSLGGSSDWYMWSV